MNFIIDITPWGYPENAITDEKEIFDFRYFYLNHKESKMKHFTEAMLVIIRNFNFNTLNDILSIYYDSTELKISDNLKIINNVINDVVDKEIKENNDDRFNINLKFIPVIKTCLN